MIKSLLMSLVCLIVFNLYLLLFDQKIEFENILYIDFLIGLILIIWLIWEITKRRNFQRLKKELCENPNQEAAFLLEDFENSDICFHDLKVYENRLRIEKNRYQDLENSIVNQIHEIKIPLSSLYLQNDDLQNQIDNTLLHLRDSQYGLSVEEIGMRLKDLLRDQRSQYDQMNRLLNLMLDSSRISSELTEIRIRKVPLKSLISRAIKDNSYRLIHYQFSLSLPEEELIVCSDDHWLSFVLNQLIDNAIKYRSENPKLSFSMEKIPGFVYLKIKDNGQGIASEDLPTIFEKGFTGTNKRNQKIKSTGMGLYFSKMILEKMQSSIDVESKKNEGTQFAIKIPINEFELWKENKIEDNQTFRK